MDYSFDQQGSLLLDHHVRSRQTMQLTSSMIGDSSITTAMEPILNRISMIENRLNASDSIYRLAAQANSVRDKQRREQIKQLAKDAQELNSHTDQVTSQIRDIPNMVSKAIEDEINRKIQSQIFKNILDDSHSKLNEKLSNLENIISETNKKTVKSIKKLRTDIQLHQTSHADDNQAEEIQAQINEMKRYQDNIMSLIKTAIQHSDQDYAQVAHDLNSVWNQITKYD